MARKTAKPPRMKVGTLVGIRFCYWTQAAVVIEDRGDLGPGGEQVVRVAFVVDDDDDEPPETESPVSWLVPPPQPGENEAIFREIFEEGRRARARERAAARRVAARRPAGARGR